MLDSREVATNARQHPSGLDICYRSRTRVGGTLDASGAADPYSESLCHATRPGFRMCFRLGNVTGEWHEHVMARRVGCRLRAYAIGHQLRTMCEEAENTNARAAAQQASLLRVRVLKEEKFSWYLVSK